jgi:hypothetical protein
LKAGPGSASDRASDVDQLVAVESGGLMRRRLRLVYFLASVALIA